MTTINKFDYASAPVGTSAVVCFDDRYCTYATAFRDRDEFVAGCVEVFGSDTDASDCDLASVVKCDNGFWRQDCYSRYGHHSVQWYDLSNPENVKPVDVDE